MRAVILGSICVVMTGCMRPGIEVSVKADTRPDPVQARKDYESTKVMAENNDKFWKRQLAEAKTEGQRRAAQNMLDMNETARKVNEINKP